MAVGEPAAGSPPMKIFRVCLSRCVFLGEQGELCGAASEPINVLSSIFCFFLWFGVFFGEACFCGGLVGFGFSTWFWTVSAPIVTSPLRFLVDPSLVSAMIGY